MEDTTPYQHVLMSLFSFMFCVNGDNSISSEVVDSCKAK